MQHTPPRASLMGAGDSTPLIGFDVNPFDSSPEIHATAIKLPTFWTNCPDAWFAHTEIQFQSKSITVDRTKYEYLVTALPQEVIVTVLDFIQNPPSTNLYEGLKKTLLDRLSMSESKRLDKILSESEMGDQKPSQFYRSLLLLAGTTVSSELIYKLWLRKLPKSLNIALTGSGHTELNVLLGLADNLWEVIAGGELSAVSNKPNQNMKSEDLITITQHFAQTTNKIMESFNKLSIEVQELRSEHRNRSHSRNSNFRGSSRRGSFSRKGSCQRPANWVCKYHYKFGSAARKCEQPCSYRQNDHQNTHSPKN